MLVPLVVFTVLALVAPQVFPGVQVRNGWTAFMVAVVFGFLNLALGWLITTVLAIVSFPLAVLTGGLFKLVVPTLVNGVLLKMTDGILREFEIKGWVPALGMGFLFALGGMVVRALA